MFKITTMRSIVISLSLVLWALEKFTRSKLKHLKFYLVSDFIRVTETSSIVLNVLLHLHGCDQSFSNVLRNSMKETLLWNG